MNKIFLTGLLVVLIHCGPAAKNKQSLSSIPAEFIGNFKDDYGIKYTISNSQWIQHPGIIYHLISYNSSEKYFIARNDGKNPSEAGLYSRIDVMDFQNMEPFRWGFCLTAYKAQTPEEAIAAAAADLSNPRKGCGGFPFSRMKRE